MQPSYFAEVNQEYDGRWVGPSGDFLIGVKRTSNARDLRGALLALAYALEKEPVSARAILVIVDSKLTSSRLEDELVRFRSIVKDAVGRRIDLVAFGKDVDRMKGALPQADEALALFIHNLVCHEVATQGGRVSRVFVQSLVVDRWLQGRPMKSSAEVVRESKASKPTVTAALEKLKQLGVIAGPFGAFTVHPPNWDAWQSLAQDLNSERKTIYFADPSGLPRGPTALASRLNSVMARTNRPLDIALGGVMAAAHFYEQLNITAAPRLDLSVYDGSTTFVRKLDAGLLEVKKLRGHAPLVLHLGRRIRPTSVPNAPGVEKASPLECLADLLDIGFMAEAHEFAEHLNAGAVKGDEGP